MVTEHDIERHGRAARAAFDLHAAALGRLIRNNKQLSITMCRWMSMNVSVFHDVATALVSGARGSDDALQAAVAAELAALRSRAPHLASDFETALLAGLRSAVLLRLREPDGATENGRRILEALLHSLSETLVPRIVDLGMAARAKRGRLSRIGAALGAALARLFGRSVEPEPRFKARDHDLAG